MLKPVVALEHAGFGHVIDISQDWNALWSRRQRQSIFALPKLPGSIQDADGYEKKSSSRR